MIVYGYHAVYEALEKGLPIHGIYVDKERKDGRVEKLKRLARVKSVKVLDVPREKLFSISADGAKTGFIAIISEVPFLKLEEFLEEIDLKLNPILVALDDITDVNNVGSIARTSAFFGLEGIVVPERRSAYFGPQVAKVSAGGIFNVKLVRVKNLVRAIEVLKKEGFWIVSLMPHERFTIYEVPVDRPLVFVLGNEERGVKRIIVEKSDFLAAVPGSGKLDSLNVGCAFAIAVSEVIRRRKGY
ncbi:MAG: 23S rRNA (guanosine(2251)-2'-O)-methyltransferase RlmB [candidate division WOR-3 bacterium]